MSMPSEQFTEQGPAYKIATMASKSCNAVSPRDLYMPVRATVVYNDDTPAGTPRQASITVEGFCYFGTRINIHNQFVLSLNGHNQTVDVNGWVTGEAPGKGLIATSTAVQYDEEGHPLQKYVTIPFSGSMTYYSDVSCTTQKTIDFSHSLTFELQDMEPRYSAPATPTLSRTAILDDGFMFNVSTSSFGEGGGKYLYVEVATSSTFATVVATSEVLTELSGSVRISNLQRNTRYYYRAVAANNGMTATGTVGNARTLAASRIDRIIPTSQTAVTVTGVVFNGGGSYVPTTKIQKSSDMGVNWSNVGSSTTSTTGISVDATGLSVGTTYLFRTVTTTSSGTYNSAYVEYTPPAAAVWGHITSIEPEGTQAVVKFTVHSTSTAGKTVQIYYRPYGMEEEWVKGPRLTNVANDTEYSGTLTNLVPNYAEYEVMINVKVSSSVIYDSEPIQFRTVPTTVQNCTCDSLEYLTQLICQSLKAISTGNIKVYANDDTKAWCEGGDSVPTLASIWSRITRYMHAVACTLCSMDGFIDLMGYSTSGQVYTGEVGWANTDGAPKEGSSNLVLSRYVKTAIDDLIRKVWHYVGAYDYYAYNLLELNAQSGTAVNQTAVVANKKYRWNGSSWVENGTPTMENFGVIHINNGRYADRAFYWFVDGWNHLDADTDEIKARLTALEAVRMVQTIDGTPYVMKILPISLTDAQIAAQTPTDATRTTIIILTEDY